MVIAFADTCRPRHLPQRCGICAVTRATQASKQRINNFIFVDHQLNVSGVDYCVVYNCVVLSSRDTGARAPVHVSRMRNSDHLYDDITESQMLPQ